MIFLVLAVGIVVSLLCVQEFISREHHGMPWDRKSVAMRFLDCLRRILPI
jgi:hypothetical protein